MRKPAGIIKQMSLNGSLLIPAELRDALGWQGGAYIEIYPFDGFLVLKSAPEKDGVLRELNKVLREWDEESLQRLLLSVRAQKKKQGQS